MTETLVTFLQMYILPLGAPGVFLASVIEEVVAPIPSALIMTVSGFIFVSGPVSTQTVFNLVFKVALPAAIGVTIGSFAVYFIARYGGKMAIEKWGRYIGLYWRDVEKLQNKFSGTKKDEIMIGAARIMPFVPSVVISAFCGLIQMKIPRYFLISLAGTFTRGVILGAVGWQAGDLYQKYATAIAEWENYVLYTILSVSIIFIVVKWRGVS